MGRGNGVSRSIARTEAGIQPSTWAEACLLKITLLGLGSTGVLQALTWNSEPTKAFCLWMAAKLLLLCGDGAPLIPTLVSIVV